MITSQKYETELTSSFEIALERRRARAGGQPVDGVADWILDYYMVEVHL